MSSSKRPRASLLRLSDADTIRFLELYEKEKVLYDSSEDGYRSRDQRLAAAKRIASALNAENFGPEEVISKFKNLRNSYSQELKKIEESETCGFTSDEAYRPKIHWFRTMDAFLRRFVHPRSTQTTLIVSQNRQKKQPGSPAQSSSDNNWEEESHSYIDIELKQEINNIETEDIPESRHVELIPTIAETNIAQPTLPLETPIRGLKRKETSFQEGSEISVKRKTCSDVSVTSERNKLATAVEMPEDSADKAVASRLEDAHDQFGKYIASLLRAIGYPEALRLHQEITALILSRMRPSDG